MGGDYYNSALSASDNRMDYDHEEPHKMDPLKTFSLKVKNAPGKGLTTSHAADMVKGKEAGSWDLKHKTQV